MLSAGGLPQLPAAAASGAVSTGQEPAGQEAVESKDPHVLLRWESLLRHSMHSTRRRLGQEHCALNGQIEQRCIPTAAGVYMNRSCLMKSWASGQESR